MNRRKSTRNTRHKNTEVPLLERSVNILLKGINQFHGVNLAIDSDVDQDTFEKLTKHNTHDSQEASPFPSR